MAVRDSHILMRYRGFSEERARAAGETAVDYATEKANPGTLRHLAGSVDELRWISGVAGVAQHLCEPLPKDN